MNPSHEKYVPLDMLSDISDSGFLNRHSKYYGRTTYSLFMDSANISLITNMINKMIKPLNVSVDDVYTMMSVYKKIKTGEVDSESIITNPLLELAFRNKEFIHETSDNIIIRHREPKAEHIHQQNLLAFQNIDDVQFKEVDWGTRYGHLKDPRLAGARDVYRWGNRIPPDRVSAQKRHYDRDINDSLRDIRQLETPISGYDMSALTSHSSNNNFPCGEYAD